MPKNIDGISLPERRKSIRNIPIPEGRRRSDRIQMDSVNIKRGSIKSVHAEVQEESEEVTLPPHPRRSGGMSPRKLWFSVGGAVIIIVFAMTSLFHGATLTYVPRSAPVTFASEAHAAYKGTGTGLMYSVVKLSGDKSVSLPANGESTVSRKASGTIIVYNNQTAAQNFVENTRFESTDSKIYRIAKAISIPAKTSAGPGSLEVAVYADQPGAEYNLGLSDFTVPGLKGTAKYETVYARSKTPMAGGFVGKEKVVNPDELTAAKVTLQEELTRELVAKAQGEVPTDFILYPTLATVTFDDLPQTGSTADAVTVNIRGNLTGLMFKRSDFVRELATGKATFSQRDELEIDALDTLSVSFLGQPVDVLNANRVDFRVTGAGNLVWKTDEVAVKAAVAGKKKSDLPQIVKNFPTISSTTASFRPFWKTSFPTEASQITVKRAKLQ